MTLREFIKKETPTKISKLIKVNYRTVMYWQRGDFSPRVGTIKKIIKLSNGKLTFRSVMKDYFKSKNK